MVPSQARTWLTERFVEQGLATENLDLFDSGGQAVYQSPAGDRCLFWIPDEDARWFMYSPLWEVNPDQDANILALALTLNLASAEMADCSLGLNPESRQLLLFQAVTLDREDLDVRDVLSRFIERCRTLKGRLQSYAFDRPGPDPRNDKPALGPILRSLA